jgi:hypothetical protein
VRVVELAPFINAQPVTGMLVLNGSNVTLSASATYAAVPGVTNNWFKGNTAPAGTTLHTDTSATTNLTSSLTVNNIQTGTNYYAVFSDAAGSINSAASIIEVVSGPANAAAKIGTNSTVTVTATGQSAPTAFLWLTNGVPVANGTKYAGATTASLTISNTTTADTTIVYSVNVTNAFGGVTTPGAQLVIGPAAAVVAPASTNALWGSSVTFSVTVGTGTAPFTYQWKKSGVNIGGATLSSFTIPSVTGITNSVSYTVGVTNGGGGVVSSAGVLTVTEPQPSISAAVSLSGGNVALSFTSANGSDTTSAFILQSSPVATGPYTNTPGTFTTTGGGNFQVTSPQTSSTNMFYRLLHAN